MTSIAPYVARLAIYPIKSLDAVLCDRVTILKSGALKGDRTWAIFDRNGGFVNGKSNQKIYALRSQFDRENNQLSLRIEHTTEIVRFNIISEQDLICDWLENYFGFPVT
ncbi:MAG: MOSC N-terminal beta barrel domain-containing protein, partial [Cyanobacteria bacterium P01_A01_bin.83]